MIKTIVFNLFIIISFLSELKGQNLDIDKLKRSTINTSIQNQFSKIVNVSGNSSIGNFLGIDIQNTEVKANINGLNEKGDIFNIGFSSSINSGLSELFKSGISNNSFKLQCGFHKNLSKIGDQYFLSDGLIKYEIEIEKIKIKYTEDSLRLIYIDSLILSKKNEKEIIQNKIKNDSSIYDYKNFEKITLLSNEIISLYKFKKQNFDLDILKNERDKNLIEIKPNLTFKELNLKWISLVPTFGLVNQNWIKHSDDSILVKIPLSSYGIEIAFNNLVWKSKKKIFFKGLFGIYEEHFIKDGKDLNFIENSNNLTTNKFTRYEQKTYKAILGGEENAKRIFNFGLDFYYFFGGNESFAFHIAPSQKRELYSDEIKKYSTNLMYGFLLNFVQKDIKVSSRFNIEVFHKLSSNQIGKVNSIFGINFILPLNFNLITN